MREVTFQKELADAFRAAGWWAYKMPDTPAGRMAPGGDGKTRFVLPKPFDLLLYSPTGQGGAVECKLARGPIWKVDERATRQIATLVELASRRVYVALAVNFRYDRKRPWKRVNRAFLIHDLAAVIRRGRLDLGDLFAVIKLGCIIADGGWTELPRVTGGWRIPPGGEKTQ